MRTNLVSARVLFCFLERVLPLAPLFAMLSLPAFASLQAYSTEADFQGLLTKGKLEADLGDYSAAAGTFSSVASEQAAPTDLRFEALVRYALVCSAAGNSAEGLKALRTVRESYSEVPGAAAMLLGALASGLPGKVWLDFKDEFEDLLRTAEIVSAEELGLGFGGVQAVYLKKNEIELKAIWRPSPERDSNHEIAAYELDKILELDMVPPTVGRELEGHPGSLQLWVHGCRTLKDVNEEVSKDRGQNRELLKMLFFDYLVANRDRNLGNVLVDPSGGHVLVDHSEAFSDTDYSGRLPDQFDRRLVEKVRHLSRIGLQVRLEGVLEPGAIDGLIKRGAQLLAHMDRLIAQKGESEVLF